MKRRNLRLFNQVGRCFFFVFFFYYYLFYPAAVLFLRIQTRNGKKERKKKKNWFCAAASLVQVIGRRRRQRRGSRRTPVRVLICNCQSVSFDAVAETRRDETREEREKREKLHCREKDTIRSHRVFSGGKKGRREEKRL